MILDILFSQKQMYLVVDLADINKVDSEIVELPLEVLQNIYLPGLPFSRLCLKIGVPVMLLRNLCPQEGLCNRLWILIYSLGRFMI